MNAPPHHITELMMQLQQHEIVCYCDEFEQIIIDHGPIHIFIGARPHYCDRGRWQVNARSIEPRLMCIDHSDNFPHYYFHNSSLVNELRTWIDVRMSNMQKKEEATRAGG